MKRQTLVNVLLIIVGILLAFTLFAAGVLWYRRAESKTFHPEPGCAVCSSGGATSPTL
jgi:hypothetical protein